MRSIRGQLTVLLLFLALARAATAEVVRIEVGHRDDLGTHERIIGRVFYEVDPAQPANRQIADIDRAPRNSRGLVEFSGDVMFFRPKDPARTRGTVFLEVVNRGREQSLGILSGAQPGSPAPESWDLGDRFLLEQGFAVAFVGWQFDVRPTEGLGLQAPIAAVTGPVRQTYISSTRNKHTGTFALSYCAADPRQRAATLTFRPAMDKPPRALPREAWQFTADGCAVRVTTDRIGIYEVVYVATGSPVAGLGMAAVRDFAAYLKYGEAGMVLREAPNALQRVVGYGYSQSARFLRDFVRDGFNADERGRAALDGMMISSAGAGGGSFNHRFAMPGIAGNSVLSVLRPVDVPPFTDDTLLASARAASVTPKIVYTFSSTEYWARAGSLTQTSDDGLTDVPLAPTSRLYFLAGTPHALGTLSAARPRDLQHFANFAEPRWVTRALLLDLDAWTRGDADPPPSRYPSVSRRELVPFTRVHFPDVPSFPFPTYMPQVWRMDYGPQFAAARIITKEPPQLGAPYRVLVPQVDEDGNDVSGVRLPEVAVPLGTYTGWNVTVPALGELKYLAGLVGGFEPFARTREQRDASGDARRSISERYSGQQEYLNRVRQVADELVRQRFLRPNDEAAVLRRAEAMWTAIAGR